MDPADYRRAVHIAHKAVGRRGLSTHDFEEACQDAALAMWRNPDHPVTAAWWAAQDYADNLQYPRRKHAALYRVVSYDDPQRHVLISLATPDPANEVTDRLNVQRLLTHLTPDERQVVEAVMYGWRQSDVCRARGETDGNTSRRYNMALAKLRILVST